MPSLQKKPSLLLSFVPVFALIGLLVLNIAIYKDESTNGPNQLALLLAALVSAAIGVFALKVPYQEIEDKILRSISLSMQANIILLVVGSLIGLWIYSGVVPAMIYYGIKLISPSVFLPVCCIVCTVVSLATGSSWSTGGTVGIALIGIGQALGLPVPMVAGAVISGSYFGDKISPLSDTTILAPAMAGTDLFTHIRYMLYTTVPSFILALIGYFILGIFYKADATNMTHIDTVLQVMETQFNVSPWLFLLPLLVFFMIAKKVDALPALIIGCLVGALFVVIFQYDLLFKSLGGNVTGSGIYKKIIDAAVNGFKSETGNKVIDSLLSRGGMTSMLSTVWLILMAMIFGGVMEATGMLEKIAHTILKMVRDTGGLITATISSCILTNLTAADQYLAIVIPGKMFKRAYDEAGLAPQNLSRCLDDSGTVTSVLVPWNTCGAFFATVLGVSTASYLPFCFFNLINPLTAIVIGNMGWKIAKLDPDKIPSDERSILAPELG